MAMQIEWSVREREWVRAARIRREQAPGSDYDRRLGADDDLLTGLVQVRRGRHTLFPTPPDFETDGLEMSVLDLASQLDVIVRAMAEAPRGKRFTFAERAGYLQIDFHRTHDVVVMTENAFSDDRLEVPLDEWIAATRAFLADVARETRRHVSTLLEFESFAPLRDYADADAGAETREPSGAGAAAAASV